MTPELMKNLQDKDWRVNNVYTIIDKNQKSIPFKRNRAQQHFAEHKAKRNIILKSRQLGFTTDEAIDILDDCIFTQNFSGLFIAHTQDVATEIFDKKVSFAWMNMPEWIRNIIIMDSDSSKKLKFDFGDNTFSTFLVAISGRSGTNNRVHISEFAKLCAKFPERANEVITGTIPSVPMDGRIDIESTAEGMGGYFADMFWEAWNRGEPVHPTQFKGHFYNWTWDDEELAKVTTFIHPSNMEESLTFSQYQQLHKLSDREITYYYLKWLSLNKDWDKLHQEYPTTPEEAFILSGRPYFNNAKILEYIQRAPNPIAFGNITLKEGKPIFDEQPIFYKDKEFYGLKVWEYPKAGQSYIIGGDVAEGVEGGDYSVLEVIEAETLRCVASFKDLVSPDSLVDIAFALGMWYNYAYMGIEVNKDGLWVNTELFKRGYPNLYYREEIDTITNKISPRVGFLTSSTSRPVILAELQRMINTVPDVWTNKYFLTEALTFVKNEKGRPEAMLGKHDDEVMAMAIAFKIRGNAPNLIETQVQDNGTNHVLQRLEKLYGKKGQGSLIRQDDYY